MGYYEYEPSRGRKDSETNFIDARMEPIEFDPENYYPNTRYLLPHELTLLQNAIKRMSLEQGELGVLLAEAMDQSSETYHDNAPQEVIVSESVVLTKRAEPYIRALGKLQVVHYPLADSAFVTIGKRVSLRLNTSDFVIDVVGASWLYEEVNEHDIGTASYDSPIAKEVLNKSPGESIDTIINGKHANIEILDVQQNPLVLRFANS